MLHGNFKKSLKADTLEGFCFRSMFQSHFARVSTHEGAFSSSLNLPRELAPTEIFNRINIVEHFAGWKFCSRRWSIPMKSLAGAPDEKIVQKHLNIALLNVF